MLKRAKKNIVHCPECERRWPLICEQSIAIDKRGKCIPCIIDDTDEPEIEENEFEPIRYMKERISDIEDAYRELGIQIP